MAKFIFKLQSLLSIKYKLEDQAKAEYGMELVKLHEEEMKLEALIAKKEGYQARLTDEVQNELDLMKIRELEDCVEFAKYEINVQRFVVAQQQQRVGKA